MKSQRIRIRNLPQDPGFYEKTVHVKPTPALLFLLGAGIFMLFMKPYLAVIGAVLIILSVFCIVVMPDRNLCQFTNEYLVLYNQQDRSYCYLVYWDEIVWWRYENHSSYDQMVIMLVDGSTQILDIYSLRAVKKWMNIHAAGKMKKNSGRRKEAAI